MKFSSRQQIKTHFRHFNKDLSTSNIFYDKLIKKKIIYILSMLSNIFFESLLNVLMSLNS